MNDKVPMAISKAPTDQSKLSQYTPMRVLDKRQKDSRARGDRYVASMKPRLFKFRPNFNVFADQVAHDLRHTMVYRSDGGNFARALVRHSGDLKLIHDLYSSHGLSDGDDIRLEVIYTRRKEPVPPNRWVMQIRFRAPDWMDGEQGVVVQADPTRVANARCQALDGILGVLELEARKIAGPEGKWLNKVLEIADRQDCPKNLDLWYYNRQPMVHYMSWRTHDKERREMTSKTNGSFPFDGSNYLYGEWRIFPFRRVIEQHGNEPLESVGPRALRSMLFHVEQISSSLNDVNRELAKSGLLRSELNKIPFVDGSKKMYGLASPFLDHLKALQANGDHLYWAFR